jgi:fatty acid CoA ligase FadD9
MINQAICTLSNLEVQLWARGEGVPRYFFLDTGAVHSVECHDILSQLWCKATREEEFQALREIEPNFQGGTTDDFSGGDLNLWVLETNIAPFLRFPITDSLTVAESINAIFSAYEHRPLFGSPYQKSSGALAYKWSSYSQVREKVFLISLAMRYIINLPQDSFIGICMSNRPEWLFADFATLLNFFVSVGLMASWPKEDMIHVIKDARISCIFCDTENLEKVAECLSSTTSQGITPTVVVIDSDDQAVLRERSCTASDISVVSLSELIKQVSTLDSLSSLPLYSGLTLSRSDTTTPLPSMRDKDSVVSLIYSSGSTGTPKGVIITEERWLIELRRPIFLNPLIIFSYAPLAHGMDRGLVWTAFSNGGRIGFGSREGSPQFFNEIALVQPTIFAAMPSFWSRLYAMHQSDPSLQMKHILGTRLSHVATGGSKTPPRVLAWMSETWNSDSCFVTNNYGTTEAPGISQNGQIAYGTDLKLLPVTLDGGECFSPSDTPFPRGEIAVKSKSTTIGYWNLPEETSRSFTEDGYFMTGDLGLMNGEGLLEILDRKKNICEMYREGRSVWVSPAEIESCLQVLPFVTHVSVHSDRMQGFLIAIISVFGVKDLVTEEDMLSEIRKACLNGHLEEYKVPQKLIVDTSEWTVASSLLLGIGKVNRRQVFSHFQERLGELFALEIPYFSKNLQGFVRCQKSGIW